MARRRFPDSADRLAYQLLPSNALGVASQLPAVVYDGPSGSDLADISTDPGDEPIAGSVLAVDVTSGLPDFLGPDDDRDVVYVSVNGGPRYPVRSKVVDRVEELATTAGVALTAVGDLTVATEANASALVGKVGKGDIFINVKDWPGIAYNGITDDSVAFRQLLASIPAPAGNDVGGICLWFPRGVMLLNTPDGDGWLGQIRSRGNVTLMGAGNGARIRTSSASAEGVLLVQDCTLFTMENLLVQVIGTARVKYGIHYTTSSPGSAHEGRFTNVKASCNGTYRKVYDFATIASSTTVYSAQAAFTGGDVGGVLMLNLPSGPHFTGITAVATLSATLAADVTTTTQTTLTLTAPLPGAPASGFTIKVGTERMFVSAGGTTTTLTVTRGRGPDLIRTTHTAGASVVTYSATLADALADTVTNATVMGRIQPAGSAVMQHGIAIAASPTGVGNLDVANTILDKVSINRAAVAGIRVGNGTAANVLDQYAYGLSTAECAIGVHTHGGSLSVYGGQCSVNLIDFRRNVAPSSPVVIDGLRSEDAGMFYEMTGQASAGPSTTIRNVEMALMHAEDGVAIRHLHSGALHLEQVSIKASDVGAGQVSVVASGTSSFPCHLTVINFATSGGNLDPFSASVAPATIKTILNAPRMLVPSRQVFANTVLGTYFGNRVHVAGGFVRGRTAVADAPYTVLQTDTVIAYTSLTAGRVVTLPAQGAALLAGQEFTIKDESGSCDVTKTITVTPTAGLIDGAANVVLNSAYAKVTVYTNGVNWFTR